MKKNIRAVMMVVAIALVAGVNMFNSQRAVAMSDIALANVEALANDELHPCPNGCVNGSGGCFCHEWYPYYKEA